MVSLGNTLGQGDTLSLVQQQGGVMLAQLKAASGVTSGTLLQIVDGNGNVTAQFDASGLVTSSPATAGAQSYSGVLVGQKRKVITLGTAARSLLASESGSLVVWSNAAGAVVTLPPPAVGLEFYFSVGVTITSNNAEVDTDAGTTFILGSLRVASAGTPLTDTFSDGTKIKIQMNGTTKGGILGSAFGLMCVTATQWQLMPGAVLNGSGVAVTPFA